MPRADQSEQRPLIEIVLAKILWLRYIAFIFFVRYVGRDRIALTTVKTFRNLAILLVLVGVAPAVAGPANLELQPSPMAVDENSRNLFNYETTYTFQSDFEESKLGHGDSIYNDFSYDHRFLIKGNWYFSAGIEYERYDFGGSDNGLPDHLQALYGHLALEYDVKDTAGISIEADPGVFFQDDVSGNAFDVPGKAFPLTSS